MIPTDEYHLLIPCPHGNIPKIKEIPLYSNEWKAQCNECNCGHNTKTDSAPIFAALTWKRNNDPKCNPYGKYD